MLSIGKTTIGKMAVTKKTIGSRASVIHGNATKTSGGLVKSDLKRNKSGSIVSKKKSLKAKKKESPLLKAWRSSVREVYKKPKYAGRFIPIKRGSQFYKDVKAEYAKRVAKLGLSSKKKSRKTASSRK